MKKITILWVINLIAFTSALFAYEYTNHINHWTRDGFYTVFWGLGISKAVLSAILIALFLRGDK